MKRSADFKNLPNHEVEALFEHPFWRDKKVTKAYEKTEYTDGPELKTLIFQFAKKDSQQP